MRTRFTRKCSRLWCLAAALLALAVSPGRADQPGDFAFYVLALSWSPTYCEQRGADTDPRQCAANRAFGFIVHGLWPQRERGYPENCRTGEKPPSRELVRNLFDIMPSEGLIRYQWRKHGACSGLGAQDYFTLLREAREHVVIPPQFRRVNRPLGLDAGAIENAFTRSNPGLRPSQIAVGCEGDMLEEVRICLGKDLGFRDCAEVDRRGCRRARIEVPATRPEPGR